MYLAMERFDWDLIEVAGTRSGNKTTTCPVCSHNRKKKKDRCLSVSFTQGKAYCHHCGAVSFEDENKQAYTPKQYELPPQEWRNYTALSDKLVKWVEETRKIKQATLMQFGVTEEKQYIPQVGKEQNCIVFNYFEAGVLVNKKYRDAKKNFTQSKGGKPIFYNINAIAGADKVYIVEGEFDVLAMYEAGIKNCISLPSGANDNDDYWTNSKEYLSEVQQFVIAVDNDDKGKQIREKIAHRLGKYRCTFIEWKGKDANDDLLSGDIWQSVKQEQSFPVSGTYNFENLEDDVLSLYNSGLPKTMKITKPCFDGLDKVFTTMQGQMTVVTGIPSHGKSNFLEWYVLNLIDEHELKASIYSPEHNPMELHMSNLMQKAVGKPFFGDVEGIQRMTIEDIARFKEWAKNRLYLTNGSSAEVVDWDWLLDKFKEQIFTFGINLFVVDAWNKVQMPKGMHGKEAIDSTLTKITAFCQQHNVQVFLVAHPTKMKKNERGDYEVPQLYDVSGSADFRNQTHNGFCIYRHFETENQDGSTDFYNLKTKFSWQGNIGAAVKFRYHVPTARYYVDGCAPYVFDLTKNGAVEPIDYNADEYIEPKKLTPNEDFDFEPVTECPF
jgi:twinkle protein